MVKTVGVIGLGYVGLPLVIEFSKAGYTVTGFDIDREKVEQLNRGQSYISYIEPQEIVELVQENRFTATGDFSRLKKMEAVIIAVPTPLSEYRDPDLQYVVGTTEQVSENLQPGQLVVLESTTYPGTTEETLLPILSSNGLEAGRDFYLAYSPERVDPNNKEHKITEIPKVIGGITPQCLEKAKDLYARVFKQVVPVSNTRVAEASKLLENIYRSVNIAMVNELKILFDKMGIDLCEVVDAAATKPFGFMPFYPGPGLGGHCIPIDPFYLSWKAREYDFSTKFIELAGEINTSMPAWVVQKTVDALNAQGKSIKNARVLLLGAAYKKDVDDYRESPSIKIIQLLKEKAARVSYNDPYIPVMSDLRKYPDFYMESVQLDQNTLAESDCVLIATDHSDYDYDFIYEHSSLVVDTRNVMKGYDCFDEKGEKKIFRA